MMASSVKEPFDSPDWIFETKLDGYRAIAVIDATGKARLWSRNRLPLEPKFPTIGDALRQLKLRSTILDGEIVALDDDGIPRKWESMLVLALAERSNLESPTRTLVKVGEPSNATNTGHDRTVNAPVCGRGLIFRNSPVEFFGVSSESLKILFKWFVVCHCVFFFLSITERRAIRANPTGSFLPCSQRRSVSNGTCNSTAAPR